MGATSLAALLDTESARVEAGEAGCARSCDCHPGLVCGRTVHPDTPDERTPHLALGEGGQLVQWAGGCCGEPDQD